MTVNPESVSDKTERSLGRTLAKVTGYVIGIGLGIAISASILTSGSSAKPTELDVMGLMEERITQATENAFIAGQASMLSEIANTSRDAFTSGQVSMSKVAIDAYQSGKEQGYKDGREDGNKACQIVIEGVYEKGYQDGHLDGTVESITGNENQSLGYDGVGAVLTQDADGIYRLILDSSSSNEASITGLILVCLDHTGNGDDNMSVLPYDSYYAISLTPDQIQEAIEKGTITSINEYGITITRPIKSVELVEDLCDIVRSEQGKLFQGHAEPSGGSY